MSTRPRIATAVLAGALLALLLAPPLAGACNEPTIGINRDSAGPNDPVGFTIVNAQPHAEYDVTIAGRVVASGTSSSVDGHSGSFAMPDLGPSQRVAVELMVTHPEPQPGDPPPDPKHGAGPWSDSKSLQFVAPVAAATPSQASQGSAPDEQSAAAAVAAPARGTGAQVAQRARPARAQAATQATRTATRGTTRARATTAAAPIRAATPAISARPDAIAAAGEPRATRTAARGDRAPVTSAWRAGRVPPAAVERPVPAVAPVRLAARADASDRPHPLLLAGLAVLLGMLAQAGCVLARLRISAVAPLVPPADERVTAVLATQPVPCDDIEAELQQILAEAHAARCTAGLGAGDRPPPREAAVEMRE